MAEVEMLANFKHHLQTSGSDWHACTKTVNSFNKDEFTCQLNTMLCHMSLQSTTPLHQISTSFTDAAFTLSSSQCFKTMQLLQYM